MEEKFTSLAFTARIIKGFGWFVSLVGAIGSVAFVMYGGDPYQSELTTSEIVTMVGLVLVNILIGVFIMAIGQLIECILSIEENIRKQTEFDLKED